MWRGYIQAFTHSFLTTFLSGSNPGFSKVFPVESKENDGNDFICIMGIILLTLSMGWRERENLELKVKLKKQTMV